MTGGTNETGHFHPSGAPKFNLGFSWFGVTQSLVFLYLVFCMCFCHFSSCISLYTLLLCTASDYSFDIFKLFFDVIIDHHPIIYGNGLT